jgi:hypothetical protein
LLDPRSRCGQLLEDERLVDLDVRRLRDQKTHRLRRSVEKPHGAAIAEEDRIGILLELEEIEARVASHVGERDLVSEHELELGRAGDLGELLDQLDACAADIEETQQRGACIGDGQRREQRGDGDQRESQTSHGSRSHERRA